MEGKGNFKKTDRKTGEGERYKGERENVIVGKRRGEHDQEKVRKRKK